MNCKIRILGFVVFLFPFFVIGQVAIFKADAGENQVICLGQSTQIGGCQFEGYTYKWSSSPFDPNFNSTIAKPVVNPSSTTTYTLTMSGPACNSANNNCISQVTVVVIEDIILTVEDNLDNDECMVGRNLTFTAEMFVNIPNDLMGLITDNGSFNFSYSLPNGNLEVFSVMNSSDLKSEHEYLTKDFPGIDYLLNASVELVIDGQTLCSSSNLVQINIIDFGVEYFRDAGTGKDWKVVVGRDIEYEAYGSRHAYDWKWEFTSRTSQNELYWNSQKGNKQGSDEPGATIMKIPYSDLTTFLGVRRANNSWFGNSTSQLKLSAKNGEGDVFIIEDFFFYDEPLMIFFEPGKSITGNAPTSNSDPPMWYLFWKDEEVVIGIGNTEYDHNEICGRYDHIQNKIFLGKNAEDGTCRRFADINVDGVQETIGSNTYHIQLVTSIIVHENYHREVLTYWSPLQNNIFDVDNDDIPGAYELTPGVPNQAVGRTIPLRSYFYASDPGNPNSFGYNGSNGHGSGYEDHEVRCMIEETRYIENNTYGHFPAKNFAFSIHNPLWEQ